MECKYKGYEVKCMFAFREGSELDKLGDDWHLLSEKLQDKEYMESHANDLIKLY